MTMNTRTAILKSVSIKVAAGAAALIGASCMLFASPASAAGNVMVDIGPTGPAANDPGNSSRGSSGSSGTPTATQDMPGGATNPAANDSFW